MNVNIDFIPKRKKIIKKILIIILFSILCFFIKSNVFALSVPSFLENYSNYYVDCSNNFELCLTEENHTFKAFIEYYIGLTHPYVLVTQFDCSKTNCINLSGESLEGIWHEMFFFSEIPIINCNYSECFIYSNNSNRDFSVYYRTINSDTAKNTKYLKFNKATTNFSSENYIFIAPEFFKPLYSNFDIKDLNGNIIFNNNSNGTSDWTDTEDIPRPDNRNWLEKLADSIVEGFYNLGSFFIDLPKNIGDVIKDLFIPGDELEDFFEDEYEYIKQQLGFLTYPIEIVVDFANRFYELDDTDSAVFKIPKLEIFNKTIYEGTSFDLMSIINENDAFKNIYNIYKIAVSGFIVLWLVQLAIKKEHEIFGGGIS